MSSRSSAVILFVNGGKAREISPEILQYFKGDVCKYTNRVSVATSYLNDGKIDLLVFLIKDTDAVGMRRLEALHELSPLVPIIVISDKYESQFCTDLLANGTFAILLREQLSTALVSSVVASAVKRKDLLHRV